MDSAAQVPPTNGCLQHLKLLGLTMNGVEFPSEGSQSTWRRDSNGNPANMLDIVRTLLPQFKVAFIAERDVNRNVVVYAVNESAPGVVNGSNPMSVFWLMIPAAKNGSDLGEVYTEDLTKLEQTLAYGLSKKEIDNTGKLTVSIRAVSGEPIALQYDREEETWSGVLEMNNQRLTIRRFMIFTEARKWSVWPTTVELHVDTLVHNKQVCYHFSV